MGIFSRMFGLVTKREAAEELNRALEVLTTKLKKEIIRLINEDVSRQVDGLRSGLVLGTIQLTDGPVSLKDVIRAVLAHQELRQMISAAFVELDMGTLADKAYQELDLTRVEAKLAELLAPRLLEEDGLVMEIAEEVVNCGDNEDVIVERAAEIIADRIKYVLPTEKVG
ncbi:MAG: hypothetical protein HYW86_02530 [Candidatus Roizmanbacteria bacterium]|nr:MAG: hypothetical protein HYW86_02530 [Candidatus Roizmanbacteria bacterium]